jgi:hypothetical protein
LPRVFLLDRESPGKWNTTKFIVLRRECQAIRACEIQPRTVILTKGNAVLSCLERCIEITGSLLSIHVDFPFLHHERHVPHCADVARRVA